LVNLEIEEEEKDACRVWNNRQTWRKR
jgi:hypothetical protein